VANARRTLRNPIRFRLTKYWYACKIEETTDGRGCGACRQAGERSKSSLKGASKGMYQSMSKKELRKMAKTKRKGKPTRKRKKS
jgi:hypothetical protein